MLPQPYASIASRARNPRIDQLDPRIFKRCQQLHQGIDVGPDHAVAGFHALNGRNRKVCQIGHLPLIDAQERASGPELIGGNHGRRFSDSEPDIHSIENWGSTIDFQARHISLPRRRRANDHGENVRQERSPALVFSSNP
jgi:hypothetical protein